jgi:hypothetical protein
MFTLILILILEAWVAVLGRVSVKPLPYAVFCRLLGGERSYLLPACIGVFKFK